MALARDKLINHYFLKSDCTHAFFIDSDMFFTPDAINWLLGAGLDVVSARYNKKHDGGEMVGILKDESPAGAATIDDPLGQIVEREALVVGLGFCAIRRNVFEKMVPTCDSYAYGNEKQKRFFPDFKSGEYTTEDTGFSYEARKLGFKLHINPGLRVGHVGSKIY